MVLTRQATIDNHGRQVLALIHGSVGVGALAGGLSLITGWMSPPREYLEGSDFSSYLIPGLALATVVGGSSLIAATAVWRHSDRALELSLATSLLMAGWFAVQVVELGVISWLQPFMMSLLVVQAVLALVLRSQRRWPGVAYANSMADQNR